MRSARSGRSPSTCICLPALSRDFGAGASQVQLTLSACLLGLALGQIIAGPLSDALGRRRPLLVGVGAYALASLQCAVAPFVGALVALRFIQGLARAAGIVIARAVVRDLHSGVALARFFSVLMLVSGLAPILAPIRGGQLLRITSWRGVFITLAVIGVLLLLGAATGLPESLPPPQRHGGSLGGALATFARLLRDRFFFGYALAGGLAFAAMFAYISGSPFVLQEIYGVSPQLFSVLFGLNALGLMAAGQVNGRLVGRVAPRRLLVCGLSAGAIGGLSLLGIVTAGRIGLAGVLPALFVVVASLGFVLPNATALALAGQRRSAGAHRRCWACCNTRWERLPRRSSASAAPELPCPWPPSSPPLAPARWERSSCSVAAAPFPSRANAPLLDGIGLPSRLSRNRFRSPRSLLIQVYDVPHCSTWHCSGLSVSRRRHRPNHAANKHT